MITAALRTTRILGLVSGFVGRSMAGKTLIRDRVRRKRFFTETTSLYTRKALGAMKISVEVRGYDPDTMGGRNFLIVSNHLSYLDIFILSSFRSSVFITSVDMGETPFLGQMAELGGSIFVERRHRARVGQDIETIAATLKEGFDVTIYPEGTSTNGETLLPFKKSLLMAAVESGRDILPVCVRYVEVDGKPFGADTRDLVCWYGKMSFAPHFIKLMTLKKVRVVLDFLPVIPVRPDSTRQELAEKTYAAIHSRYHETC